ncbi:MAG: YbjN domain-containing protein [Clostridiales bacterium]|nr:YbjN domain-containing protein [Clostridiales bacterium]
MDKNAKRAAQREFDSVCAALTERGWDYDKDKENYSLGFLSDGKEMRFSITVKINPELKVVSVYVILPFLAPKDKEGQLAVALALINDEVVHGNFEYDGAAERVIFRASTSYLDSSLDKDVYFYLIAAAFSTADSAAATIKAMCDSAASPEQVLAAVTR